MDIPVVNYYISDQYVYPFTRLSFTPNRFTHWLHGITVQYNLWTCFRHYAAVIYIYVYRFMYIHLYHLWWAKSYVYRCLHIHVYIYIYIFNYIHVFTFFWIYIYVFLIKYMFILIFIYLYIYLLIFLFKYIYWYIHMLILRFRFTAASCCLFSPSFFLVLHTVWTPEVWRYRFAWPFGAGLGKILGALGMGFSTGTVDGSEIRLTSWGW